jgi:phosphatidylserine/phosphatidylglycerophosphate/cardiolipin synthase-like enzyme
MRPPDRVVTAVDERRETILDVIRNARESIVLSLFRCNDKQVFAELAHAIARGVRVEALITSRAKGGKKKLRKLWEALERTGVSVHPYTDPVVKYHAKYLVADAGPAVVASLNFTRKCFARTCDAIVVTHDPAVVAGLRAMSAADRELATLPDAVPSRLIIGPERARQQFTALFERAQTSVRVIDAKLSDPELVTLLNARRAAGLTVEIYASKWLGDLKSHGKIILIDDRIAVVGSLSLSAISLDCRREVAIIVDDRDAVAEVQRLFQTLDAAPATGAIGADGATRISP